MGEIEGGIKRKYRLPVFASVYNKQSFNQRKSENCYTCKDRKVYSDLFITVTPSSKSVLESVAKSNPDIELHMEVDAE